MMGWKELAKKKDELSAEEKKAILSMGGKKSPKVDALEATVTVKKKGKK